MRRSKLLPVAMAAAIAVGLATTMAEAQKSKKAARLAQAQFSLSEAVAKAKAEAPGKAIEVELKDDDGVIYYQVEIVTENRLKELQFDAGSGELIGLKTKMQTPTNMDKEDTRVLEALKTAQTTLPQAVEIAKKKFGGSAIEAELEASSRGAYYEIDLVKDDKVREVKVAANNGEILAMRVKR